MKIEFDLPEFEKEISVNIIIRKDGEVVVSNTITPEKEKIEDRIVEETVPKKSKSSGKKTPTSKPSGNMMGMDF